MSNTLELSPCVIHLFLPLRGPELASKLGYPFVVDALSCETIPPGTMDVTKATAVLLIAHGSRHEPANADLRELAVSLTRSGQYEIVEPAFLELAEPGIAQAGDRCVAQGASRVLMIPYFLSAGVHLIRDLTAARDSLQARHPNAQFLLGAPLGPHSLLEQLVIERVQELERDGAQPDLAPAATMAERFPSLDAHK